MEMGSKLSSDMVLKIVKEYLTDRGYEVKDLKPLLEGFSVDIDRVYFDGIECKLVLCDKKSKSSFILT